MEIIKKQKNKGFTLIEALFAVFILTFSITTFMGVVASSLFSARYARDEITANYLLQEAVDYIRNDRDTNVFFKSGTQKENWELFIKKYENGGCSLNEESPFGCYIDVLEENPLKCEYEDSCYLYYNDNPDIKQREVFYSHNSDKGAITDFQRRIFINRNILNPDDEIDVEVMVLWKNGEISKSKSLKTSLLRWQ